jgi:hypothetical protein
MRPLVLPFVKTKIKPADAVEMIRQRIVTALTEGKVNEVPVARSEADGASDRSCFSFSEPPNPQTLVLDIGDRCPDFGAIFSNPKFNRSLPMSILDPQDTSIQQTVRGWLTPVEARFASF